MTTPRAEFIAAYIERARAYGIKAMEPTEDGYRYGDVRRVAVPCRCGGPRCLGWTMMPAEEAADRAPERRAVA